MRVKHRTISCLNYAFYRQVILMATQVLVGSKFQAVQDGMMLPLTCSLGMQGLRTYALYCKSKGVAALMLGVGLVLVSLSIVSSGLRYNDT